jgi:Flp pilus assembly secretin CpaC
VLLAGGVNLATAEVFNPDFDVWTTAAPMATDRRAASAVLLNDGRVLAVGGFSNASGGGEVDASEIYLP